MIREMPSVYSSSSSTTCLFNDKLGAVEEREVDFGVDMIGSKRYGGRFGCSYDRIKSSWMSKTKDTYHSVVDESKESYEWRKVYLNRRLAYAQTFI